MRALLRLQMDIYIYDRFRGRKACTHGSRYALGGVGSSGAVIFGIYIVVVNEGGGGLHFREE